MFRGIREQCENLSKYRMKYLCKFFGFYLICDFELINAKLSIFHVIFWYKKADLTIFNCDFWAQNGKSNEFYMRFLGTLSQNLLRLKYES